MTDANPSANGHKLDARSAAITPAVSNGTSGIGAPAREATRSAPDSGGADARQRPPGAASPAGWFPSPAGEAAPPVRNREPVRSGKTMPDAEPDPRPASWYRIPGPLGPGGARRLPLAAASLASPAPQPGTESPAGNADGPAPRWPLISQWGPRHIPVVGPTEALRVRAGGRGADRPPSAVPVPVSQERESGWQLAQRAWRDSGGDWETAPGRPPVPGPRQPTASDPYAPGAYAADRYRTDPYAAPHANGSHAAGPYAPDVLAPDPYDLDPDAADEYPADGYPADDYPPSAYAAAPHAPDAYPADRNAAAVQDAEPHRPGFLASRFDREDPDATRVDFGIPHRPRAAVQDAAEAYAEEGCANDLYADDPDDQENPTGSLGADPDWAGEPLDARYAAAPVLEDSRTGVGPWPVQPFAEDPEGHPADEELADYETATPDDAADPWQDGYAAAEGDEDRPGGDQRGRGRETRADRAAPRWPDAMAPGDDGPAPPTLRYARQPPPMPRRTPQHGPRRNAEASGRPAQDDRSGHVRLPSAPAHAPLSAAESGAPAAQFAAPAVLSESDELFRAWQGSVRDAAGPRTRRLAGRAARRRAAWQAAKIGVPAVVIVTVGAGALLMLTGRANEMLAERSSTGTARTGQATSTAASVILAGYPGVSGGVKVAAMWSDPGTIVAVGTADGHPAIWRRAVNGGWSLVSTADLGAMSGHLTSVAHGPAGWIAVGSVASNGVAQPMVYTSTDGVTWRTVPSLTALAPGDAQFLGVAAGRGGYLVVGREETGERKFAQLWWSPDLANWTAGGSSGYHNSLAIAAVADGDGFVAAGSQGDCHTIWTSPDGMRWTTHDIPRPAGARTATLRYAAAGTGGRVVTAGFATNDAGAIPIVVTTDAGGAQITQVVLPTGGVPGAVTGVTATGDGFVAAGMIGPAKAQRAVTWTSADGLTWSAATPVSPATGTTITALTSSGGKVTGTLQRGMDPAVQTLPAP